MPYRVLIRLCSKIQGGMSRNPNAPVAKKAARQPNFSANQATNGGAIKAPTLMPHRNTPTAFARSFDENHWADPRMAVG